MGWRQTNSWIILQDLWERNWGLEDLGNKVNCSDGTKPNTLCENIRNKSVRTMTSLGWTLWPYSLAAAQNFWHQAPERSREGGYVDRDPVTSSRNYGTSILATMTRMKTGEWWIEQKQILRGKTSAARCVDHLLGICNTHEWEQVYRGTSS